MTDCIRYELLCAIEVLEAWAEDQIPPIDKFSGICLNLARHLEIPMMEGEALVSEAAKTWPEYSGHPLYPVPYPSLLPETAFTAKWEVPKWTGKYGAARRRLCQHIANWIRAHPAEASNILWRR